jgi:carbonic anhydrase/acetyltransferase-like protein (isoleucine patch superfamily)
MHLTRTSAVALATGCLITATLAIAPAQAAPAPSFVDPSAAVSGAVTLGGSVYVGPFASIAASAGRTIVIGDESNVQDSVVVEAKTANVVVGRKVILAHGAAVRSGSVIGESGTCPTGTECPSFVSFNALVDGGIVQKDAMVSALSRVGPGVTIPSGRKTTPGANITDNSQVAAKTSPVTAADRVFMNGVIHVNTEFAHTYTELAAKNPNNVRGINYDPGSTDFNATADLPTLDGKPTSAPQFRNRIIGDVHMDDKLRKLNKVMGSQISLRADEGSPFEVGKIKKMGDRTTFHALEHSHLHLGEDGRYGAGSIVHGGATPWDNTTITGEDFRLGAGAVFFRSRAGEDVKVGARSVVQDSDLPEDAVVPPNVIMVGGVIVAPVEW